MTSLEFKARQFAVKAHGDQKYSDRPYVVHLDEVYYVAKKFDAPSDILIAAFLHDILEDTSVTKEELEKEFGTEISDLVYAVTDEPGKNREERKIKTYEKVIKFGANAIMLKLIDRIANVLASRAYRREDKLKMYKDEYEVFRKSLFIENKHDQMWKALDRLHR